MAWWSLSLRQRFALAICGTLAVVILVFGLVTWNEVRSSAIDAAETRLEFVTHRIADILAANIASQKSQLAGVARDRGIQLLSRGGDGVARDSAIARIHRADSSSNSILAIEIWDSAGAVIFSSSADIGTADNATRRLLLGTLAATDSAAIGPMRLENDTLRFPTFGPIRMGGPVHAWAAVWYRMSSRDNSRSVTDLIGPRSRLSLGNATGDLWSDLNVRVPAPALPSNGAADTTFLGVTSDGDRVLASRAPIVGSPWIVSIEFPYAEVVQPILGLGWRLAVFGLALLLVGAFMALTLAGSLARPIADLASAAEGLRAGDYSRRAPTGRGDEIGNLASAFNMMADAIGDARVKLQAHAKDVEKRGAELSDALAENARTMAELDAVLTSAPVGFAFHDRDLRYVRVNDRLATAIGRSPSEIVGRRPTDVLPGIGADIEEGLSRALATGKPVLDLELAGPSPKRGEPAREWLATMFPVRTTGRDVVGVGSVLVDMSAYKGLERQFLQAQRMDAVGRLAGGIAHDFNNILTAIASFTEFAIRALPSSHAAVDDLVQVRQAVQRAAGLIRQMLAFSRQQVMQPVVLNLSDVVRNLVPMLRRLIPESVALHSFLDPDLWQVRADPVQIEQILVNLVVNARDAMPTGGTLTITTSQASLDEAYIREGHRDAAIGDYAVLSVSDSGVGMDAATKARVFEPFFTTKAAGHGTGLGLSTVYGIVKQSGGSIWLYSEPGRGTTVKIFLRRHDEPDDSHISAETPAAVESKPATILLVEDDDLVRVAALKALTKRGHRVLEAIDGEAALSVIAREQVPIDLVITDLVMPRLGGKELGERLRSSGNEAAILYMSGYTGGSLSQRALLEEGAEFLEKPFTPDRLAQKVEEILRQARPASVAARNDAKA
ncbi:MAG TPA: ATP-binding protein [Gemmatimonadaceae bacterium]|nr:ATP-binding protein [Gemmatimonadaceae bacterium]